MNYEFLNNGQRIALEFEGNLLLEACPGSGKTRTLVFKIADELLKIGNHREFVVALTYTHAAADEIRERIEELGLETSQLWVGTIHSFCLEWIINPYYINHKKIKNGFKIIDSYGQEQLKKYFADKNGINYYNCRYYADIEGYKIDQNIDTKEYPLIEKTIQEYISYLNSKNLIDFEMILMYAYEIINNNLLVRRNLNNLFKIIMVDEYQDTREIQYQIIFQIINASENIKTRLFMVGDPNQAIYSSLGGVAKSLDQIKRELKFEIHKMSLNENYRSSSRIIDFYSNFSINENTIIAKGENSDYESQIHYYKNQTDEELVKSICRIIECFHSAGVEYSSMCIVAPQWNIVIPMVRKIFGALKIPVNGPGVSPLGRDRDNFWYKISRIALTKGNPQLYFRRTYWAQEIIDYLEERGYVDEEYSPRDILKLFNSIDLEISRGYEYLESYFSEFLIKLCINCSSDSEIMLQRKMFLGSLKKRLEDIYQRDKINLNKLDLFQAVFHEKTGVTFSTIHGVKGEEYDLVIAFGLKDGMIPHWAESDKSPVAALDSSKRLLYVLASRAQRDLFLFSERRLRKNPTPILDEICSRLSTVVVYDSLDAEAY